MISPLPHSQGCLKYCDFQQFWGYTIFGINKVNNIIIYVTQTLFKFII